ncbi:hypothetical protein HELRODRAFT_158709 [Helobdella robusta]|uniref:Uncharacterized protein n=1 Tax=Helobdella robusta TaxID=6412 RepID=T1EN54_HELRO|nr:hypothetical protein HELRODRAFT_158709 [Helobdella robusta]ESO12238.1 hypothetical protein HELRODRAFT_158709 [Helobdella robusta]
MVNKCSAYGFKSGYKSNATNDEKNDLSFNAYPLKNPDLCTNPHIDHKYNNFKWFCDTCNNVSPDTKSSTEIDTDLLARAVDRSKQELMIKIDGLTNASKIIESELRNIRCAVKLNDEKLSNINHAVDEMRTGSGGVSMSWTDISEGTSGKMKNSQVLEGSKTERKSLIERDGTDGSVDDIDFDGINVESCFRYANNKSHYGKCQYKISSLDVCGERGCNNKNAIGEFQYVEDDKIKESFNEACGKGKPAKIGNEERSVVLRVLNIRSIITKFSSIYGLIHEGLDIFVLTESWHGSADNISIGLSMPPGYQFVDRLRSHDPHHGGLIIFFRSIFRYKKITLPLVTAFEVLAVKLKINELDYILLAIYRPGSERLTTSFFDELISVLECVTIISSRIL